MTTTIIRDGVSISYDEEPIRSIIIKLKEGVVDGKEIIEYTYNLRRFDINQLVELSSSLLLEYNWLHRLYKETFSDKHYNFLSRIFSLRSQAAITSGVDLWPELGSDVEHSLESNIIRIKQWANKNFGVQDPIWPLLGVAEELGELCRCFVKRHGGIRGFNDPAKFESHAKDAIGDIFFFLVVLTSSMGWDINEIVNGVTNEVTKRDWKKYPVNGISE